MELVDEAGVQVNCSQVKYQSSVNLTIEAKRQANATVICNNGIQVVPFDQITLECDKSHLLEAYYLYHDSSNNLKCKIKSIVKSYPCSGITVQLYIIMANFTVILYSFSDRTLYIIIYVLACVAGLLAVTCLCLLIICCWWKAHATVKTSGHFIINGDQN